MAVGVHAVSMPAAAVPLPGAQGKILQSLVKIDQWHKNRTYTNQMVSNNENRTRGNNMSPMSKEISKARKMKFGNCQK